MRTNAADAELWDVYPLKWTPFEHGLRARVFIGVGAKCSHSYAVIKAEDSAAAAIAPGRSIYEARVYGPLDDDDRMARTSGDVLYRGNHAHSAGDVAAQDHIHRCRRALWDMYMQNFNPPVLSANEMSPRDPRSSWREDDLEWRRTIDPQVLHDRFWPDSLTLWPKVSEGWMMPNPVQ